MTNHQWIKILYLLLFLLLANDKGISQTQMPQFLDKENKSNYDSLFHIIGNVGEDIVQKIGLCYSGMGIFSFQVTEKGEVEVVSFEGNLPDKFVIQIKKNIIETSRRWLPELKNGKPIESLPFIFICYIDITLKNDCASNIKYKDSYISKESSMGWILEKAFNNNHNLGILKTGSAYILPIGGYAVMH